MPHPLFSQVLKNSQNLQSLQVNDANVRDPNRNRNAVKCCRFRIGTILVAGLCVFLTAATTAAQPISGWRLLRTANPRGGAEAVSMIHTADITRSDPDLAGLMLRCGEHGAEVAIVVVTPFPPRAQPDVTVGADGKEWRFTARVVPPGAELLLPAEATSLAAGPWQSTRELVVKVSSPEQSFRGVVSIDGLAAALATLAANCPPG
jgi:hypothetical protein